MSNLAANTEATGPVPPTRVTSLLDGSLLEETDIFIQPPLRPFDPKKPLRLSDIEALPRAGRGTLLALCYDLFVVHGGSIRFGPCIEGAVFELELGGPAKSFSLLDGYLTVPLSESGAHFHLCVGDTIGVGGRATPAELSRIRQCSRATFLRRLTPDLSAPTSWSLSLSNGNAEQMCTFFLPSPYLDERLKRLRTPRVENLRLWNSLRATYIEEAFPQPPPLAIPSQTHG